MNASGLVQASIGNNVTDCKARFGVLPLKSFGAQITDFSFDQPSADDIVALRNALVKYKMLLIRNKCFTPAEQISFTRIFGHDLHRAGPKLRFLPEYPEVIRISNRPGEGNANTGQYWHSDGHYIADPSAITAMHIVNATRDGATRVIDCAAAFERLPDITKEYLARHGFYNVESNIAHPIVRRHPLTGQFGLYVNLHAIAVDKNKQEFIQINEMLDKHLNTPGLYYEHHWKTGDTIIVDNFAVAHRGTPSDPANLRVMHRTTVTGPSVWWRNIGRVDAASPTPSI